MNDRTLRVDVDTHAGQRVDHGDGIRTGAFRRERDLGNICHIRGKLHHQRLFAMRAHRFRDIFNASAARAELHAALLHVRAGNVHFDHVDVGVIQFFRHGAVILRRVAGNVRNDGHALLAEIFFDEVIDTRILQTHGIQHTAGGFRNARRRIARSRL